MKYVAMYCLSCGHFHSKEVPKDEYRRLKELGNRERVGKKTSMVYVHYPHHVPCRPCHYKIMDSILFELVADSEAVDKDAVFKRARKLYYTVSMMMPTEAVAQAISELQRDKNYGRSVSK